MKKLFLILAMIASSTAFSFELEAPSAMKWGGKFSHFSCDKFSPTPAESPSVLQDNYISFNEFGVNRGMKYGVFNVNYGPNQDCEYRVQLNRNRDQEALEFDKSEATDEEACSQGREFLDDLFSQGLQYEETGRGHSQFSFRFFKELENNCPKSNSLRLEYKRIR